MKKKEFTIDQVTTKINSVIGSIDRNRNESLVQFSELENIQVELLQTERTRLLKKYGTSAHPRVKRIEAKLNVAMGLSNELDVEAEKTRVEVPPFDRATWRIHGRVLNQKRKGIEGLTVSLFNQKKQWIRKLGFACTNERGYFAIDYLPQNADSNAPDISPDLPLILTVTNDERQILHQEKQPLFVKIGLIDYREMIISSEPTVCPPPERDREPGIPLDGSVLWFQQNSVELRQDDEIDSVVLLQIALRRIQKHIAEGGNKARIALHGYACTEGDEQHNLQLSQRRAEIVRTKLVEADIPENRIIIEAHGKDATYSTLALNRRVEIVKCEENS